MRDRRRFYLKAGVGVVLAVVLALVLAGFAPFLNRSEPSWDPNKVRDVLKKLSDEYNRLKSIPGLTKENIELIIRGYIDELLVDPDFSRFMVALGDLLKPDGEGKNPLLNLLITLLPELVNVPFLGQLIDWIRSLLQPSPGLSSDDQALLQAIGVLATFVAFTAEYQDLFVHAVAEKTIGGVRVIGLFHVQARLAEGDLDSIMGFIRVLNDSRRLAAFMSLFFKDVRGIPVGENAIIIVAWSVEGTAAADLQEELGKLKLRVPVYVVYIDKDGKVQGFCVEPRVGRRCSQDVLNQIARDIFGVEIGQKPSWWAAGHRQELPKQPIIKVDLPQPPSWEEPRQPVPLQRWSERL